MAKKLKLKKPQKPTQEDLARKAKRTGYRFKTDHLKKKDGDLTPLGKKLKYKKPSREEIDKFKKNPDGSYPEKRKKIYHERRADRKHSDDNLKDKFDGGGKVKQLPPQSESYSKKHDVEAGKAKPVGYRYTDKLAKRLGVSVNAHPSKAHVEKYLGKGVYKERRKDKSDFKPSKKLEEGGTTYRTKLMKPKTEDVSGGKYEGGGAVEGIEYTKEYIESRLGRKLHWWNDDIVVLDGVKYRKKFMLPYYEKLS